jgi:hypothetical protein
MADQPPRMGTTTPGMLTRCRRAALLAVLLQSLSCALRGAPVPNEAQARVPAVQEFSERVQQYVELHRRLERLQPPLRETANADEITARRHAFADALRRARPNAVPGEFFTPTVAPYFRRIIKADVKTTGTPVVGAAAPEKPAVALRVNDAYPDREPLSSVPPLLLSQLPPLPEELEYRFVVQHLLLLDRQANLIVDFLPDASPASR